MPRKTAGPVRRKTARCSARMFPAPGSQCPRDRVLAPRRAADSGRVHGVPDARGRADRGSVVAFRDISERRLLGNAIQVWQGPTTIRGPSCTTATISSAISGGEVNRLKRAEEVSALLYIDPTASSTSTTLPATLGDQTLIEIGQAAAVGLRESDLLAPRRRRVRGDPLVTPARATCRSWRKVSPDRPVRLRVRRQELQHQRQHRRALIDGDAHSPRGARQRRHRLVTSPSAAYNQVHLYRPESDAKLAMNLDLGLSGGWRGAQGRRFPAVLPADRAGGRTAGRRRGRRRRSRPPRRHAAGAALRGAGAAQGRRRDCRARGVPADGRALRPHDPDRHLGVAARDRKARGHAQASGRKPVFTINISGQTLGSGQLRDAARAAAEKAPNRSARRSSRSPRKPAPSKTSSRQAAHRRLAHAGCLALDDFGSGFELIPSPGSTCRWTSSRSTASSCAAWPMTRPTRAIVTSINDIAHSFGKQTIAEFVRRRKHTGTAAEFRR